MTASLGRTPMADGWQAAADTAARKRRGAWVGTTIAFLVSGGCWGAALALENPARAILLVVGAVAFAIGFAYGTAIYMRRVDEQERMANLWGSYAALCVYLALFAMHALAEQLGIRIAYAETWIFLIVTTSFGVTFLWQRFR